MRVRTIQGGDAIFSALVYPEPSASLTSYFKENMQAAVNAVKGFSSTFADSVMSNYNYFNDSYARTQAKQTIHTAGMHFNENTIHATRYDRYSSPNLIMQQYIMANPTINKRYERGTCNGYDGTYYNTEPGVYGKERYDYRRAVDGMMQFDKDDEGYVMHYSQHDDNVEEQYLHTLDKKAILETWDNMLTAIANGDDPTEH